MNITVQCPYCDVITKQGDGDQVTHVTCDVCACKCRNSRWTYQGVCLECGRDMYEGREIHASEQRRVCRQCYDLDDLRWKVPLPKAICGGQGRSDKQAEEHADACLLVFKIVAIVGIILIIGYAIFAWLLS